MHDGNMNTGALNLAWADALLAGLAAAGVRHAAIAPGARSSPLALAALRRPELRCEVLNDERVAGYFAVGLARVDDCPAVVICTSGTAVANLSPAVMEANLAGMPMLVLSADRPPEAHGWGANQTAAQARLFGVHARACHAVAVPDADLLASGYLRALAARLAEECRFPSAGPVHANLPFREPLLPPPPLPAPSPAPAALTVLQPDSPPAAGDMRQLAAALSARRGVIVCGAGSYETGFAEALAALAAALDAPVLAEALSGLRFGVHDRNRVCSRQAAYLRTAAAKDLRPDWVLRFGAFPVSRGLEGWLAGLRDAQHILVAPPGRWPDPIWRSDRLLRCAPLALVRGLLAQELAPADGAWRLRFQAAERRSEDAARTLCADAPPFEGTLATTLIERLPDGAHCFVGNSLAIRAVDAFSGTGAREIFFHANRGASGIDGHFATAAGIAAAAGTPTAALIGDQAALHDAGGAGALKGKDCVVVVANNNGGGIFDHLPLGAVEEGCFERGWTAPSDASFAALAALHGLEHRRAATRDELAAALDRAFARGGPWIVEAPLERRDSLARWSAYWAAAGI
jgi:2-succinyl-5-enolpyruvyl-6-hydroxy-3-cyclohexene-1-carboxylate synthase